MIRVKVIQKGLSEEDTKELLVKLLEFALSVSEMREAQRYYYRNKPLRGRQVAFKNMVTKEYKVDMFLTQFKKQ